MEHSNSIENYLKAIFSLQESNPDRILTNDIAAHLGVKSSSVTDMIKKLQAKELLVYEKYKGVKLTKKGEKAALLIIRKHRLWEVFLVNKLGYTWSEVHLIAEQLEHIISEDLIDRLDKFLEYPRYDPHGEPIPNKLGQFSKSTGQLLSTVAFGVKVQFIGVKTDDTSFLKFLEINNIALGDSFYIKSVFDLDDSFLIQTKSKEVILSKSIANLIMVEQLQ